MRWLLVLLTATTVTCGPSPNRPVCIGIQTFNPGGFGGAGGSVGGSGGSVTITTFGQWGVVGEARAQVVELGAVLSCDGVVVQPSAATASEVIGPDGAMVPHTLTSMRADQNRSTTTATVTFTPTAPGPYALRVRFEPNIGVARTIVDVIKPVPLPSAFVEVPARAFGSTLTCADVIPAGDSYACRSTNDDTWLLQPGRPAASLPTVDSSQTLEPDPDGFWRISQTAVEHYAINDGGVRLLGQTRPSPFALAGHRSGNALAVVDAIGSLALITPTAGTLQVTTLVPSRSSVLGGSPRLVSTDAGWVAASGLFGRHFSAEYDGGLLDFDLPGEVVGREREGLWLMTNTGVEWISFGAQPSLPARAIAPPPDRMASLTPSAVPAWLYRDAIVHFNPATLLYEANDVPSGLQFGGLNEHFMWFTTSTGSALRLYAR